MTSNKATEHGFTLVEVLVALVVVSLLLGTIMNAAISGRDRQVRSSERRAALALARALLIEAAASERVPGIRSGAQGSLRWTLREDVHSSDTRGFYSLMLLKVEIRNRKDVRLFDAETFRLKPVVGT